MANLRKGGAKDFKSYGKETGSAITGNRGGGSAANLVAETTRRGGGGGSSSGAAQAAADRAAAENAAREAVAKAAAEEALRKAEEAIKKQQAEKAAAERNALIATRLEQNRIINLKQRLANTGAQTIVRNLKDAATGERIRTENVINQRTGERVFTRTNLDTGAVDVKRYQRSGIGQPVRLTGGLSTGVTGEVTNIKDSFKKGKVDVKLRNGKVIDINARGGVVLSKSITGLKNNLYFYDGQLVDKLPTKKSPNTILKKIGIDTSELPRVAERYLEDVEKIKDKIRTNKNRDVGILNRVAEITRNNPGLTDLQLRKKIESELTNQSLRNVKNLVKDVSELVVKTAGASIINLGYGTTELLTALKNNPKTTLLALPPAVLSGVKRDFNTVKSGDALNIAQLAVEYYTLGKVLGYVGRGVGKGYKAVSKLSPRYAKLIDGKISLRKSILSKKNNIILKESTVKSGAKTLSQQTKLAGKKVTAVNASANQLTSLLKRKQLIRKPIPGESNFPKFIKDNLKKFDTGKITNKQFAQTNKWLQKNVAPNTTLLERSLYLDPAGGLRLSRLGVQTEKTASLRDILRGNFKLIGNKQKPQVLIFENAKIAKFPKSLKAIERKLKAGKKLNVSETNKLIKWQVKTGTGKFKPIGSTIYAGGKELEITLAPGEFIKRLKQVGFTYVKGKKVTFVTAEVFKPTKTLSKQIRLANLGKLTKSQLSKLEKLLSKKLGRKIKIETPSLKRLSSRAVRRADPNIPVLRLRAGRIFVIPFRRTVIKRAARKTAKRKIVKRKVSRKTVARKTTARKSAPRKTARPKPRTVRAKITPRKTAKRVTPRVSRTQSKTKKKQKVVRLREKFKPKTLSKSVDTYYVVEKVRGKYKKLYPKPLTRKDAKDFAVYSIDNNLSKTAFFVPLGKSKKVTKAPKSIQGYYSANRIKVRPYRIRFGKKKLMVNGFIELRKYSFDKPGEKKRGINRTKKLRNKPGMKTTMRKPQQRRIVKRIKTKMSPARKRQLLKYLAKARKVKAKKRR